MKSDLALVRSEMRQAVLELKVWAGGTAVLLFGALAAIRFFVA